MDEIYVIIHGNEIHKNMFFLDDNDARDWIVTENVGKEVVRPNENTFVYLPFRSKFVIKKLTKSNDYKSRQDY